jgi:hypothetical protein
MKPVLSSPEAETGAVNFSTAKRAGTTTSSSNPYQSYQPIPNASPANSPNLAGRVVFVGRMHVQTYLGPEPKCLGFPEIVIRISEAGQQCWFGVVLDLDRPFIDNH